jgi:hypothetical protein
LPARAMVSIIDGWRQEELFWRPTADQIMQCLSCKALFSGLSGPGADESPVVKVASKCSN